MMVTTHVLVHRMRMTLNRFRREPKKVYDTIYEVQEQKELSVEFDQTQNPDRTDSDNSNDDLIKKESSELGLKNVTSVKENENEENKSEEQEPKP